MKKSLAELIARTWIEGCLEEEPLRLNKNDAMEFFSASYSLIKAAVKKAKELASQEGMYFDYDPRTEVGDKGYFRICPAGDCSIADRMNQFQHKQARDEIMGAKRSVRGYHAAGFGKDKDVQMAYTFLDDSQKAIEYAARVLGVGLSEEEE